MLPSHSRRLTLFALATSVVVALAGPSWGQPGPGTGAGTGTGTGAGGAAGADLGEDALAQALARFENGERAEASAELLAWLAAHPDDDTLALAYSRELNARRAFDEGIGFLRDYVAMREAAGQQDAGAAAELGGLLMTLLRYEEAAAYLERVPPSGSLPSRLARLNLGKVYRALGRFEEARPLYAAGLDASSGVFAQAALCEIALALEGPEPARTCLVEGRARFGAHGAFEQPAILAAYLDGDFASAMAMLEAAVQEGGLSARLTVTRPLVVLALSGPEAAREAVERVDQITAHGERDAVAAAIAATGGDLHAAAVYYASAVAQNPLFERPSEAGRVLFWRPEVVAALEQARAANDSTSEPEGTGVSALPAEGTGARRGTGGPVRRHESGCCRVAGNTPADGGVVALLTILAAAGLRRRRAF